MDMSSTQDVSDDCSATTTTKRRKLPPLPEQLQYKSSQSIVESRIHRCRVYIPLEDNQFAVNSVDGWSAVEKPYHISLSRIVRVHELYLSSFVDYMQSHIAFKNMTLSFSGLSRLSNDDLTKDFVGVLVSDGVDHVLDLITQVDIVLSKFSLEPFYALPEPHVSVLWRPHNDQSTLPIININPPNVVVNSVYFQVGGRLLLLHAK